MADKGEFVIWFIITDVICKFVHRDEPMQEVKAGTALRACVLKVF